MTKVELKVKILTLTLEKEVLEEMLSNLYSNYRGLKDISDH